MDPTPRAAPSPPQTAVDLAAFNPHHLELFYYVARHGGISAASRHMPHGIGQPAISGQMADFEFCLGTRLFERKPFRLTEPGRLLYARLEPFYTGLPALWKQLQGAPTGILRLAVDEMLGAEFNPVIVAAIAPRLPGICLEFQTGLPGRMETARREGQTSLAVITTDRRIRGAQSLALARPGLSLFVPRRSGIRSPGHFWRQGRIAETLICPAESGAVHRTFERGLRALRVDWRAGIRVDSTAVMLRLVAAGHGVGVGLALPSTRHPDVRAIPLTGFEPVQLVALWRKPVAPWHESLLATVRDTARRLWPMATLPAAVLLVARWIMMIGDDLALLSDLILFT